MRINIFDWFKNEPTPVPEDTPFSLPALLMCLPKHSQDIALLEQREHHLVFDYGPNLPSAHPISEAYTYQRATLWDRAPNGDGILAVAMRMSGVPRARIAGTLNLINTEDLLNLDIQRKNGVLFRRKRVPILLPQQDRNGEFPRCNAWAYVANPQKWNTEVNAYEAHVDWVTAYYRGKKATDDTFRVRRSDLLDRTSIPFELGNCYKHRPLL